MKNVPRLQTSETAARPTRTRSMPPPARWSVWMPTGRRSCLKKVPEDQQFDRLKALFSADVDARAAAADKTDAELANAFAFLDAAIPDSQELVLFATELTANWFTSWFIQNFGCDAYFAHNKRLLFDDTQKQLLQDIESARNEES